MCLSPASILYKSIAGRCRPVSCPDGPIAARYRFVQNAYRDVYLQTCVPKEDYAHLRSLIRMSLGTFWIAKDASLLHADNND